MTNNYVKHVDIGGKVTHVLFFDDRDPAEVQRVLGEVSPIRTGSRGGRVIAYKAARDLFGVDDYVV